MFLNIVYFVPLNHHMKTSRSASSRVFPAYCSRSAPAICVTTAAKSGNISLHLETPLSRSHAQKPQGNISGPNSHPNMHTHPLWNSFPGGKRDPTDVSTLATALRETEEEISIPASQIEILGSYSAMPNKGCTMRVQPYVGIIRTPFDDFDDVAGLDSVFHVNQDEVSKVFAVPIEELMDPAKRELVRFRSSNVLYPVWKIDKEDITIWGLTAFILDGKGRMTEMYFMFSLGC